MQIKGFLFDLDGVIVDTAKYHYLAWRRMANELGFDISEEFNEKLKGISRIESLKMILEEGNKTLSDAEIEKYAKLKNEWYLELVNQMNPDEILVGIPEFFKQLKAANIKCALGSVSKNAQMILEKIGLLHEFDAIIDGTKITNSKPHPEVFLKGAEALGLQAAECIVFEDAEAGIEAAHRAGMKAVGIGKAEVLTEAETVIPSFEGVVLKELIERLDA